MYGVMAGRMSASPVGGGVGRTSRDFSPEHTQSGNDHPAVRMKLFFITVEKNNP